MFDTVVISINEIICVDIDVQNLKYPSVYNVYMADILKVDWKVERQMVRLRREKRHKKSIPEVDDKLQMIQKKDGRPYVY